MPREQVILPQLGKTFVSVSFGVDVQARYTNMEEQADSNVNTHVNFPKKTGKD